MKELNRRWFVAVWEDGVLVRIYDWGEWLRVPVGTRDLDDALIVAKDELEAYQKAKNLPRWLSRNKPKKEQTNECD